MGDDLDLHQLHAVAFISIHIPRVGDDGIAGYLAKSAFISIHIPRVGDDNLIALIDPISSYFNPHPPCGG